MDVPMLRLMTVKRRGPSESRYVRISHAELDFLIEYIELYRAPIVNKRLNGNDHGFFFINHRTAKPITPNTVTLEVHILRRAAGIEGKAHPHLFRHKFMTDRIRRFVVAHDVRDAQQFLEVVMKFEHLRVELMEETGIKSVETLDVYVDWVFALSPFTGSNAAEKVDIGRMSREGRALLAELEAEREGMSASDFAERTILAMKLIVGELSRADGFLDKQTRGHTSLEQVLKARTGPEKPPRT